MEIEWTETALDNMADLDKGIARRVKQSLERFASASATTGRFHQDNDTMRIVRVRNRREVYR